MTPRVSVVMAVYNGAPFIEESVGNILAQKFTDFELIVVDDGSTDRSVELLRTFGDRRIRIVQNERNRGLAASLNRGIALACGEYIARHDVDDRSAPDRFAKQVAFLHAHPEVVLLGTGFSSIDANGKVLERIELPTRHHDILWHMCWYCPFAHTSVMWRRADVSERFGGYDESLEYSEDFDLWRRISASAPVANLPEALVDVRIHDTSMTATYEERAQTGFRMRVDRVAALLGWPLDRGTENAERFRYMFQLFAGRSYTGEQGALIRDAEALLQLHRAFGRTASTPAQDVHIQDRLLRNRLRRALLRASRHAAREGKLGTTVHLVLAAARLTR